MSQLHAVIHGHVQGVSFRYYTVQQAFQLGLTGWVKNNPDGTVETVAVGPREKLEVFLVWLGHGPSGARVSRLDNQWQDEHDNSASFQTFEIVYNTPG